MTVRLPTTTKTISETTASAVESPSWARPAATPTDRARFFGFTAPSTAPRPSAIAGVSESIRPIHFGIFGSAPGAGRFRHSRLARSRKVTPSPIFSHDTELDEVLLVPALLWSEMT